MPALGFKQRFAPPIWVGLGIDLRAYAVEIAPGLANVQVGRSPTFQIGDELPEPKLQTIRAHRKDGRPHCRPGDVLSLYCGMRTKQIFLIGRARCIAYLWIEIRFGAAEGVTVAAGDFRTNYAGRADLDRFARGDGFASWAEMREFWREEHGTRRKGSRRKQLPRRFRGDLIQWEPLP